MGVGSKYSGVIAVVELNTERLGPEYRTTGEIRVLKGASFPVYGKRRSFQHTDLTGGSVLWSESLSVQFNNGYYATVLGTDTQNNALDSDTLLNYPVYLEVQLDANTPMSPRQAINSAQS